MNSKITQDHPRRRAVVYIRQSTPIQVFHNLESQRRQYGLAEYARQLGFHDVVTIDDDLGKSDLVWSNVPAFNAWSLRFVAAKSALSYALKLRAWRGMGATGII